jgi:hypothetical protein
MAYTTVLVSPFRSRPCGEDAEKLQIVGDVIKYIEEKSSKQ